ALVVGGVELDDLPDPEAAAAAIDAARFVVSLEVRESAVTERADVVLPVAAVAEKAGTFITWEGRHRPFGTVLETPNALTDTRVLAGIAEELGAGLAFRTVERAGAELAEIGPWDGDAASPPTVPAGNVPAPGDGEVLLDMWRLMVDDGRGQDGDEYYKATARRPVLRAAADTLARAGLGAGDEAVVSTPEGAIALLTEVADLPDGVVWVPANSDGLNVRRVLKAGTGDTVRLDVSGGDTAAAPSADEDEHSEDASEADA
ncbi:MAG: NADH-quinone oxidoreductase subunit G, partial [Nocardioidaceae bacterium]